MFSVEKLDHSMIVSGVMMPTKEETVFEDLPKLSKEYAKIKTKIDFLKTPVYTIVATSDKTLFMGDVTSKKNAKLASITFPKDMYIVKVPVPFYWQITLPAKVAKIRKQFYQDWLPNQPYESDAKWKDLEVYHYRQRYFRKSRRMIMEIWFCLKTKQEL